MYNPNTLPSESPMPLSFFYFLQDIPASCLMREPLCRAPTSRLGGRIVCAQKRGSRYTFHLPLIGFPEEKSVDGFHRLSPPLSHRVPEGCSWYSLRGIRSGRFPCPISSKSKCSGSFTPA